MKNKSLEDVLQNELGAKTPNSFSLFINLLNQNACSIIIKPRYSQNGESRRSYFMENEKTFGRFLISKRQENEISARQLAIALDYKEMFRSKKQEIEDRVAKLTEEIKGLQPEKEQTSNEDFSVKLLELRERLKEYTGFDYSVIPESIVEAFIERIWVSKDEFRWYLRTGNNADGEFDPDDHIKIGAFTLTIDDAKKYIYSFSTRRRVYKWADLNVSVWI